MGKSNSGNSPRNWHRWISRLFGLESAPRPVVELPCPASEAAAVKQAIERDQQRKAELQSVVREFASKRRQQKNEARAKVKSVLRSQFLAKAGVYGSRAQSHDAEGKSERYILPGADYTDNQSTTIEEAIEGLGTKTKSFSVSADILAKMDIDLSKLESGVDLSAARWAEMRRLVKQTALATAPGTPSGRDVLAEMLAEMDPSQSGAKVAARTAESAAVQQADPLERIYEALSARVLQNEELKLRPDLADIDRDVRNRKFPTGPLDNTAFYDFHSLSIAWENTWTSVFDKQHFEEVVWHYHQTVETVGKETFYSIIDSEELDDLESLISALSEMGEDYRAYEINGAPPHHRNWQRSYTGWQPDIEAAWKVLTAAEKQALDLYYILWHYRRNERMNDAGLPAIPSDIFQRFDGSLTDPIPRNGMLAETHFFAQESTKAILTSAAQRVVTANENASNLPARVRRTLTDIQKRMHQEPYKFDIFVPNSYNFGLMKTYRQKWTPLDFQAGQLLSTLPLTPGEKRAYTIRRRVTKKVDRTDKSSRSQKETSETSSTVASHAEIVEKTISKMEAMMNVDSGFEMEMKIFKFDVNSESEGTASAYNETMATKRHIREETMKSAQEYKDENSVEVVASSEIFNEYEEKNELSNPNNEITVTYLFYELQRRFNVTLSLDRLTPVILVAQEVPPPSEIDEDWLMAHTWILRKSLLDSSLSVALDYLRNGFVGEEISIDILRVQWENRIAALHKIETDVTIHTNLRNDARRALLGAAALTADKFGFDNAAQLAAASAMPGLGAALGPIFGGVAGGAAGTATGGPLGGTTGGIFGGILGGPLGFLAGVAGGKQMADKAISSNLTKDELAAMQESARLGEEWASADYARQMETLTREVSELDKATQQYVAAIKRRQTMRTLIDQLRIHVKDNILFYMQAIWAHEHPDQRYLRLYKIPVDWYAAQATIRKTADDGKVIQVETDHHILGETKSTRALHEVAKLGDLLAFWGNYAIFPLNDDNAITEHMSMEFLDEFFEVYDLQDRIVDKDGTVKTEEQLIAEYRKLWQAASALPDPAEAEAAKLEIARELATALRNLVYFSDDIVVPTGEVAIEALPGTRPLLEDFKLRHRAIDMKRAEEELLHVQIDALRRVRRLMGDDLADPDIDKFIKIEGNTSASVDPATE